MRIICAWCKLVIREGDVDALLSHGMCEACLAQQMTALDNENGSECATTDHSTLSTDSVSD